MKRLNFPFFKILFYLIAVLSVITSCKDDDDQEPKIYGYNYLLDKCSGGHNYTLNEEGTACVCPESTHYQLPQVPGNPDEFTLCRELTEGSFLYRANVATCLYEVRDTNFAVAGYDNVYEAIGLADFNFENKSILLWLGTGGEGERFNFSLFGLNSVDGDSPGMSFHEDGSFSVSYKGIGNVEGDCLDWKERSPDCFVSHVTTTGRSNPERTKINLEMRWTDCHDNLLDIGTIEMWKEW